MKKFAALALILLSVFCLCSCQIGSIKINLYTPYWNFWNYSSGSSFTYNASDIEKVDITWVGGEIEIVVGEGPVLAVTENSEELSEDEKMHYFIKDGKLTIHYSKAMLNEEIDPQKKHLRVEVPEGVVLDIDNVGADIKLGNAVLGKLKLANVSGNIEISGLICNEIKIDSLNGAFYADDIVADEFEAKSVSGAMDIAKIASNKIEITTVSGKIDMNIAKNSEVKISGVSGEILLGVPDDIGATVEFSTISGNFSSEKPHKTSKKTHVFGQGEIQVSVDTVSGNLNIF